MQTRIIQIAVLALSIALLSFSISFWDVSFIGWVSLLAFFYILGEEWLVILKRTFQIHKDIFGRILSWFAVFVLMSLLSSVFVVYYTLTTGLIATTLIVTALTTHFLAHVSKKGRKKRVHDQDTQPEDTLGSATVFRPQYLLLITYCISWIVAAVLMVMEHTVSVQWSPWQTLSQFVLLIMFLLTFIAGICVFSKFPVRFVLGVLVAHSVLVHLYIPLSHENPLGGDVWRHIAVEQQLSDEEAIQPVLFGPEAKWREVFSIDVPEAFLIPNKYSYGQLWGSTTILSRSLGVTLAEMNVWLIPILWSLLVPILFFYIGKVLFDSWRSGLLLSWLSVVPFTFQALGSLTLPVSLGHITFFFVLLLWLIAVRDGKKWQRNIVFLFAALMLFGYLLHAILIWVVIVGTGIIRRISSVETRIVRVCLWTSSFFLASFILPAIELLTRVSYVPEPWNALEAIKQFVGQWSGYYYASAIRIHDIVSGNIFFNHTPEYAFVPSLFTDWRWHVVFVSLLFLFGAAYGVYRILVQETSLRLRLLALLTFVVGVGYVLGWYVLAGDRLLARRLDGFVAFVVLLLFVYVFRKIFNSHVLSKKVLKPSILAFVVLLSWFATTSYASGPDMRTMSAGELDSAIYVWERTDQDAQQYCVLADTWTLLALEARSGGRIVGGGFPIDYQFGQPERTQLLGELIANPRPSVLEVSLKMTGAENCSFILDRNRFTEEQYQQLIDVYGHAGVQHGSIYTWLNVLKAEGDHDTVLE